MRLLSEVAARGTTVLCSLHQPRPQVLGLLNRVMLMSRGRVSFLGPPSEAAAYFESIGRPFVAVTGRGAGAVDDSRLLEISPADAMLDAIGDAEIEEDRKQKGVGGGGLVVMDPRVLIQKVNDAYEPYIDVLSVSFIPFGLVFICLFLVCFRISFSFYYYYIIINIF